MRISVGLLTISGVRDDETDEVVTNAALRALDQAGYDSVTTQTVSLKPEVVEQAILELSESCDIVLVSGGTGFGPHDVVPEITKSIVEREAPGLTEHIRSELGKHSETAYLYRGVAGIKGRTVIINLPTSAEHVKTSIETVSLLIRPMMVDVRDVSPVG
jgi:molybdenum cofactor synthesis domain-containing protein